MVIVDLRLLLTAFYKLLQLIACLGAERQLLTILRKFFLCDKLFYRPNVKYLSDNSINA